MVPKDGHDYLQIALGACIAGSHMYMFVLFFAEEVFTLVSWPEEDKDVSILSNVRNKINGSMVAGATCEVCLGKKTFPALVHATGV